VSHPNIGGNFGGWIEDYQLPKGVLFVVSEWGKSYADVDVVGAHLTTNPRGSQVTLHWYYDSRKKNYAQLYEDFSDVVTGKGCCVSSSRTTVARRRELSTMAKVTAWRHSATPIGRARND